MEKNPFSCNPLYDIKGSLKSMFLLIYPHCRLPRMKNKTDKTDSVWENLAWGWVGWEVRQVPRLREEWKQCLIKLSWNLDVCVCGGDWDIREILFSFVKWKKKKYRVCNWANERSGCEGRIFNPSGILNTVTVRYMFILKESMIWKSFSVKFKLNF